MRTTTSICANPKCGKEFVHPVYQKTRKYCSLSCNMKGRKPKRVTVVCAFSGCGKIFMKRPSSPKAYCSRSCANSGRAATVRQVRGEMRGEWGSLGNQPRGQNLSKIKIGSFERTMLGRKVKDRNYGVSEALGSMGCNRTGK